MHSHEVSYIYIVNYIYINYWVIAVVNKSALFNC